jgi:hypothetical protein
MLLTDNETKVDLLNNEAIAATIVKLLRARPDRPVTIGVHGDWGAGKSSVLEMIEAGLNDQNGVLCLKFNGWRFQGFEDAKIALIEGIVTGLIEKRSLLNTAADAVKNVLKRIDWLKVAKKAGGLAWTAFTGIPTPEQLHSIVATFEGLIADPTKLVTKENVESALGSVKSVLKPETETKSVPEEIRAFRKAFDDLLKEAGIEQLVVLIDDLDRCLPDTAIETLEAVRLFVFTERTAFVVAADEAMIEYAVRKHFPELPDTTGPRDYARNYLEKLIQVPFRIPALGETETRVYVTLLLIGAELGEDDKAYAKLIVAAREKLRRPWESTGLDPTTVRATLIDKAERAQNALILSEQIGPILASGAKGNPRQIKRFLNTLLLRQRTAEARGFGSEVKLPVLAKLMLAERFLPRLFDQIASAAAAHPKGRCEDLLELEAATEEKSPRSTAPAEKPPSKAPAEKSPSKKVTGDSNDAPKLEVIAKQAPESVVLTEWLSSQPIRAWASISPSLSDVDLRPYLFVTKDRKDYFGAVSVLGHLASVVEDLLRPKMAVQALEPELKRLAGPEAEQVFEAVRGRIMGSDTFDKEPAGIAGLTVLVRAHPSLQSNLLSFLETLPKDRCGPWAVSGWESVIKDTDAIARFAKLLEAWSTMSKNPVLKTAATSVLKTRRGGR